MSKRTKRLTRSELAKLVAQELDTALKENGYANLLTDKPKDTADDLYLYGVSGNHNTSQEILPHVKVWLKNRRTA